MKFSETRGRREESVGLQVLVRAAFLPREVAAVPRDPDLRPRVWTGPSVSLPPPPLSLSSNISGYFSFCEAPASVAPYVWPDDITKWPICRKRKEHADTPPSEAEHMVCEVIGHPCCIGIRGQCQITTKEFCDFVKGVFHEEAALCSQVNGRLKIEQ